MTSRGRRMATTQDETIAELQRANVKLRQERDAALAQRNSESGERIDHQAATLDVLKAMSASPGDAQPVYDLIARHARELCNATASGLLELDGGLIYLRASPGFDQDTLPACQADFPMVPTRGAIFCRAIVDKQIVHIRDMDADPDLLPVARNLNMKSTLAVPLMRDGAAIGSIGITSRERGGFSESQIALLQTFAEQAVIAISSAETYRALQTRTADLQESLEYQTATIDVLKVMSSSTSDTEPVFDIILRHAMKLCNCKFGGLQEFDGELVHLRATRGFSPDALAVYAREFPKVPTGADFANRAILTGQTVHIPNVDAEPGRLASARGLAHKSNLAVPLLREGTAIGAISLGHVDVDGFTDAHVELLKTFAEQAVIAIGSTATFRALQDRTTDLQELLEFQTATSDVLKVISRSTFDLQPVLDLVAETAAKLCDAEQAAIYQCEGGLARLVANCGFPAEYEALVRGLGAFPLDLYPQNVVPRAIREGRTVHIHDVAVLPGYGEGAITLGKQRTSLGVPLLREGEAIGAIVLARQRVEPFTDRQIDLVSTFADQAVIAIENTRLITEQQEALEQQTATAEVLQVINASPGNLTPVFDAMLEKAMRLCEASFGSLWTLRRRPLPARRSSRATAALCRIFEPRGAAGWPRHRPRSAAGRRAVYANPRSGRRRTLPQRRTASPRYR